MPKKAAAGPVHQRPGGNRKTILIRGIDVDVARRLKTISVSHGVQYGEMVGRLLALRDGLVRARRQQHLLPAEIGALLDAVELRDLVETGS